MIGEVLERLVDLTDAALDERIRSLELERRRLDSELAAAIAVADSRRLFERDGHRSMRGYLSATCHWSGPEIGRFRSAAEVIDRFDELGTAWMDGRIGFAQVCELGKANRNKRITDELGEFVRVLTEHAEQLPFDDYKVCVERVVSRLDDDGARPDPDDRNARVVDVQGGLDVRVSGGESALTTAQVLAIFNGFVDAEFQTDLAARDAEHGDAPDGVPLPRTAKQRRHDAFVAMVMAAGAAMEAGLDGVPPAVVVNVLFSADRLASTYDTHRLGDPFGPADSSLDPLDLADPLAGRCETDTGIQLDPHDAMRASLEGHVRRVVLDSDGTVVDYGRKQRLFTGSARDAAKLLARHCSHPGCDLPTEWCQVDHADEWERDVGPTDQSNSRIACGFHNRWKHRTGARSKRATDGHRYVIRADGTAMLPVGARAPIFPDDPDDTDGPDHGDRCEAGLRLARELGGR